MIHPVAPGSNRSSLSDFFSFAAEDTSSWIRERCDTVLDILRRDGYISVIIRPLLSVYSRDSPVRMQWHNCGERGNGRTHVTRRYRDVAASRRKGKGDLIYFAGTRCRDAADIIPDKCVRSHGKRETPRRKNAMRARAPLCPS